MFIPPMLASPFPNKKKNPKAKDFILEPGLWYSEEKYDGVRLLTEVNSKPDQLFVEKGITSWSRHGNLRPLPGHIMELVAKLPDCYIDGEILAPGLRSYGTMADINRDDLVYYIFDVIHVNNVDMTDTLYVTRRQVLRDLFDKFIPENPYLKLASSVKIFSWEDVYALRDEVYSRDGEGLILKKADSEYLIGKRAKTWIKIKKKQAQVFTVTGFIESRGEKNYRGLYAMTVLKDPDGRITTVKTKNDEQCRKFEELAKLPGQHPAIGRLLWCEYHELTPDGEYREIRWDRWDGE